MRGVLTQDTHIYSYRCLWISLHLAQSSRAEIPLRSFFTLKPSAVWTLETKPRWWVTGNYLDQDSVSLSQWFPNLIGPQIPRHLSVIPVSWASSGIPIQEVQEGSLRDLQALNTTTSDPTGQPAGEPCDYGSPCPLLQLSSSSLVPPPFPGSCTTFIPPQCSALTPRSHPPWD